MSGNKFSMTEAHVACRQLGFYSASHWNYSIDAGYELYSIDAGYELYSIDAGYELYSIDAGYELSANIQHNVKTLFIT